MDAKEARDTIIVADGKPELNLILEEIEYAVSQGKDNCYYNDEMQSTIRKFIVSELEKKGFKINTRYDRLSHQRLLKISW